MHSKKHISILLGHAVSVPVKTTGGVEKVFEEIFYKWDDECFEFTIICRGDVNKRNQIKVSHNKNIIQLKGYKWFSSKFLNVGFSLIWCLKSIKYLTDSDFVLYNSVFGPLVHKFFRLKGLVSYCDHRGTGKVKFLIPYYAIDRLYAISKVVQNSWGEKNLDKIKIIPNCVDTDLFKFVERYSSPRNDYKVLFVGRIIAEKGLMLLLHALKILLNDYKMNNVILNIIGPYETDKGGDYVYYKKCNDFVIDNHLDKNVAYLGEKSSAQIINFLSDSNVFIMSSIWEEAFGIVNIEALATGLPIVGFNKGALPEIITHTQEGFIANAITPQALADEIFNHYNLGIDEKKMMAKRCRCRAEYYDSRKIAELYLNDIKALLN